MPYWPQIAILGKVLDLAHLDPRVLECPMEGRETPLRIQVKYSNHCFTETFVDSEHDPALQIMDHKTKRAFCSIRYEHSQRLPAMVSALPGAKVHQTSELRNYVYATAIESSDGALYEMYFTLKKTKGEGADLGLSVESAYPVKTATPQLARPSAIRFKVLAKRVFEGQPIRFSPR